jgi:hypothetical protein
LPGSRCSNEQQIPTRLAHALDHTVLAFGIANRAGIPLGPKDLPAPVTLGNDPMQHLSHDTIGVQLGRRTNGLDLGNDGHLLLSMPRLHQPFASSQLSSDHSAIPFVSFTAFT